jgi:hypothetical protein
VDKLLSIIKDIISTGVPTVNKIMVDCIEAEQRKYMWDFVAKNWSDFVSSPDPAALSYLLARRLSISLSGPGIRQIAETLGGPLGTATDNNLVHPTRYYIMPPIENFPLSGDIYRYVVRRKWPYAILLTPSCDFVTGPTRKEKVQRALFAHCLPLDSQEEFLKWKVDQFPNAGGSKSRLSLLLKNRRGNAQSERFYFLPGSLSIPDLVIDFQQLYTVPLKRLKIMERNEKIERIASIDSPFAEAILSGFARYFGRLGTPDLDIECVVDRIKAKSCR